MQIIIYKTIDAPGHGKYDVYVPNARDKNIYLNLTTTCEGLSIIHGFFSDQRKYILTYTSHMEGKVGN